MTSSSDVSPDATQRQSQFRDARARGAVGSIALILCATSVGFAVYQHGGEYTPIAMTLITFAIFAAIIATVVSMPEKSRPTKSKFRLYAFTASALILLLLALFVLWPAGGDLSTLYKIGLSVSAFILVRVVIFLNDIRAGEKPRAWKWWLDYTYAAALTLQFYALATLWPVGVDQTESFRDSHNRFIYLYLVGASAFLVLLGFLNIRNLRRWWFPAILLVHAILGLWTIRASQFPHIDVWYFQEVGPTALLAGHNPYDYSQVRFQDIYDSTLPGHQQVYGDGMVENGRLRFGFPYPPISLYCSTIGVRLGNDTRYAQALALTLAGLLIGYSRPGRLPKLAAVLMLFTPTVCFVLGRAWTEPFVIFFLSATIFCAARNLRWILPIALGLFLASKQYLVFAIPLSFLLVNDFDVCSKVSWRKWIALLLGAGLVAALVTLPLALWDWHAFWFSTVTVQKDAPFRWDALSYLVCIGKNIDTKYTTWLWLAFAGAVAALLLSIWKACRGPAGFAAAMALTYLVFIAFNKQAFCNYYFFVIGCVCCALATMSADSPDATEG